MDGVTRHSRWWVGTLVVGLTIVKVLLAATTELLPEEAYYWTYGQHPALSYFDHPPLVAWIASVGTWLAGTTELGVRLGFILLSLGSAALLYDFARLWYDERTALASAGLFVTIPLYAGTGLLAFPDGPLIFCWLLTLVTVTRALRSGRSGLWWAAGVALGGALLAKYTAILLVPSLGLFLWFSPPHRHWLGRREPWLALVMAAAVFSPVVLWNANHEWASFLFQSHRTIGQTTHAWRTVPEFWLVQLAILSPLVFAGLGWAAWRCMRQRTEAGGFALAFSLPLFAVFALASFHTKIHVNWTAPAFLSLLPALLSQALEHPAAQRLTGRRLAALTVISCLVTLAGGMAYLNSVRGWREIAERVETAEHELEAHTGQTAFVLGADKYNLAALLSFYTREPEEQVNTFALGAHGLGFRYWTDLAAWRGHPAIVIVTKTNDHTLAEIGAHFERLDPPVKLGRSVPGRPNRDLYLICGYGYRPPLGATTTAKTSDRLFR